MGYFLILKMAKKFPGSNKKAGASRLFTSNPMNKINPEKLLLSKWTAAQPENKEKHWLVSKLVRDEALKVTDCHLEAVINKRCIVIPLEQLKQSEQWVQGWK